MCFNSTTTAAAGSSGMTTAIGGVGLGLSALGMMAGANAAEASARSMQINLDFQSKMDAINARLAESNYQASMIQGERQIGALTMKTGQLKSTQRASMAANGIDLGSDSAVNILTTTDVMGEIDRNNLETNVIRNAWGYKTEAANATASSIMNQAKSSGINPSMAYNSSLLSNAGSVAMNWYTMSKGNGLSKDKT